LESIEPDRIPDQPIAIPGRRRFSPALLCGTALGLVAIGSVMICALLDLSVFGGLLIAAIFASICGATAIVLSAKIKGPLPRRSGTFLGLKTGALGAVICLPSLFAATFLNGNSLTFLPGDFNLRPFFYARYGMETGHLLIVILASVLTVIFFMAFARIGGMLAAAIIRR
jgi:hypothetical protein